MIVIKSKNEVNKVRESCRIAVDVCRILKEEILPGVETHQLHKWAEEMIKAIDEYKEDLGRATFLDSKMQQARKRKAIHAAGIFWDQA